MSGSGKRNIWSEEEVRYFLTLLKEKKILSLLDGKRFRAAEIFKTLESVMAAKGYFRDGFQLKTKYKNLKGEYYKIKRHNEQSGVDTRSFIFYDDLDELLRERPGETLMGVDSSSQQETTEETSQEVHETANETAEEEPGEQFEQLVVEVECEVGEDGVLSPVSPQLLPALQPGVASGSHDVPRTVVSGSSETSRSTTPARRPTLTPQRKKSSVQMAIVEAKEAIERAAQRLNDDQARDDAFLEKLLSGQQKMLAACTQQLIEGMKACFKKKSRKRKVSSSESSSSSSDEDEADKKKRRRL